MRGSPPTFLVTGATGFLGQHLLDVLVARHPEATLCVLARDGATWRQAPHAARFPQVRLIEATLDDAAAVQAALRGQGIGEGAVRGIFHGAAAVHHSRRGGAALYRSNVESTRGMVQLAQRLAARLLLVSTSGTVACHRQPGMAVTEEAPPCGDTVARWPYYASKIAAEALVQGAVARKEIDGIIVRPPVMLGPGDHRFRATSLIVRYLRGRLPFYLGGGMHFIDIRDAAHSLVRAMELPQPRGVYHLAGHALSLQAYFAQLQEISGVPAPRHRLPGPLALALAYVTAGKLFDPVVIEMGQHHWDMGSRYAHEIDFAPRPPRETLADTVAWLRQAHPRLRA